MRSVVFMYVIEIEITGNRTGDDFRTNLVTLLVNPIRIITTKYSFSLFPVIGINKFSQMEKLPSIPLSPFPDQLITEHLSLTRCRHCHHKK